MTEWVKCDNKDCQLVAFAKLKDPTYGYIVNVCPAHCEELKKKQEWEVFDKVFTV